MAGLSLPSITQDPVKTAEQQRLDDSINLGHTYFELATRYAPEGSVLSVCLCRSQDPNPNYLELLTTTLEELKKQLEIIPGSSQEPSGAQELRNIDRHFGSKNLDREHFYAIAQKIHELVEENVLGHFEEQEQKEKRDDRLDVSDCNPPLCIVPTSIHTLQSLTSLNLQENALTELPKELFMLERLTDLYIAANRLKSIPAAIGRLQNLRVLNVDENCLESLPATMENLRELEVLRAANNRLKKFELNTSRMHRLVSLYLYNNQLTSVTMYPARRLGYVYLENNRLTQFPNVEVLPEGCLIAVSGNPLNEDNVRTFKNEALQVYFVRYEKPAVGKKRSHLDKDIANRQ